jgi:hypothetical protein
MKKTVLTFGFLSGALSALMMFGTVPFIDSIGFDKGAFVGYTAIVLSFLFVFFGIRSYRQNLDGEPLTFGRAFTVGILITLISCVCYVVAWEIVYFNFMPDFAEKYTGYVLAQMKARGETQAALDAAVKQMADLTRLFDNPLTNAAITFIEPFPIGLVVTLVSALALRTRRRAPNAVPRTSAL